MLNFRPAQKHGKIEKVVENIFIVTGTNTLRHGNQDIQTSRNMIIIRNGGTLTLINTVRLNDEGLTQLEKLGDVENIIRLGTFHGYDDAFYAQRYNKAKFWQPMGMTHNDQIKKIHEMTPGSIEPLPNCDLFIVGDAAHQEGLLHYNMNGGFLISCDAIQNWTKKDEFFSQACWDNFSENGLTGEALIPSTWLTACNPNVEKMKDMITHSDFEHLLSAHGEPLLNYAKIKITQRLENILEKTKDVDTIEDNLSNESSNPSKKM